MRSWWLNYSFLLISTSVRQQQGQFYHSTVYKRCRCPAQDIWAVAYMCCEPCNDWCAFKIHSSS
jgi:hypothetical protein